MQTVTLKMEKRHVQLLKEVAKKRGCSQGAVMRELIEENLSAKGRPSLHEQTKDLCGSISGPRDLSTRKLTGYGSD